jgi:hypothetical protein
LLAPTRTLEIALINGDGGGGNDGRPSGPFDDDDDDDDPVDVDVDEEEEEEEASSVVNGGKGDGFDGNVRSSMLLLFDDDASLDAEASSLSWLTVGFALCVGLLGALADNLAALPCCGVGLVRLLAPTTAAAAGLWRPPFWLG